jgi:ATPase subunit of ABC transporter with duplicated ATPase domains
MSVLGLLKEDGLLSTHDEEIANYFHWNDRIVDSELELEENQMQQYKWEQKQLASMKEYIARFGHGFARLARQAQSKEKTLAKMERAGKQSWPPPMEFECLELCMALNKLTIMVVYVFLL